MASEQDKSGKPMKEDINRFELEIKAVLGDAREDVPGQVWLGIERRLSAADLSPVKKPRVIPLWLKISGGAAAAAAIAAAVIFSGTSDSSLPHGGYDNLAQNDPRYEINIEDRGADGFGTVRMADIPDAEPLAWDNRHVAEPEHPAGAQDNGETAAGTGPASASEDNDIAGSGADVAGGGTETAADKSADSEDPGVSESDIDVWEQIVNEEKSEKKHFRTSLTLSGNAISNTNSTVSNDGPPKTFAPGQNQLKEDKVYEGSESSYSIPVSFGVGVKFDFTKRWSASIGVNYSFLKRTFSGTFYDVQDNGDVVKTEFSDISNRQDYIGIPVNVYFSILRSNFIDFYAYAGGSAEKCISNSFSMSSNGIDIHHKESVKGLQFSVNAGIGMEFIVADIVGIYIDPSLRYYFPDDRQPRSIRTSQPLMFGLEAGLRIKL